MTAERRFRIIIQPRGYRAASEENRQTLADVNVESEEKLEAELLARIAKGDRQALGDLYDRQSGLLYSLILKILKDPTEAEDVLQDVFLQIWDKAACYDSSLGRPLSWTVALTRNKALDRLRSLQRRQEALNKSRETPSAAFTTGGEEFDNREISKLVHGAVRKLSSDQRRAIELAFFGGLSQTEISEQLQIPLGTVKARIRRGMLRLRDTLKRYL